MFDEIKKLEDKIAYETYIKELRDVYSKAQKNLTDILNQIDITDYRKARTQALLKQINIELGALNIEARKWAKNTIPTTYLRGIDIAGSRLKSMKVTRFVNTDAMIHRKAIASLIDDVTVDIVLANESMKKNAVRFIKRTQQRLIEDREVSKLISQGLVQGDTRRQISDSLLQSLSKQMGEEKFISINGRNYRPDKYAELVARTRTRESSSIASLNTALQYGLDLVQISVHRHPQEDPCSPFQGKIYSISGQHPDFPPLTDKPPYHPNCKHVLVPITPESLNDQGIYNEMSKFSKTEDRVLTFSDFEREIAKTKPIEDVYRFIPAKTTEDAQARLLALTKRNQGNYDDFKQGVDLPGMKLATMNSVLRGVEESLKKYNTRVNRIGFIPRNYSRGTNGIFMQSPLDKSNMIGIQKKYAVNPQKRAAQSRLIFERNKEVKIKQLETLIERATSEKDKSYYLSRLDRWKRTKRWSISSTHTDPILATSRHESYHAIWYEKNLSKKFQDELDAQDVVYERWFDVSEYAGANIKELFAETGAAIDLGVDVPEEIKTAFANTMKGVT